MTFPYKIYPYTAFPYMSFPYKTFPYIMFPYITFTCQFPFISIHDTSIIKICHICIALILSKRKFFKVVTVAVYLVSCFLHRLTFLTKQINVLYEYHGESVQTRSQTCLQMSSLETKSTLYFKRLYHVLYISRITESKH